MNANNKMKNMTASTIVLLITAFSTALITGLFYSYSCSVNPGLAKLADREYLLAMQSINRAILNPVFFASFMGTLLLLPLSAWLMYKQPGANGFVLILLALLVYGAGVWGVTMAGNVPLNEALDKFNIAAADADAIKQQRISFEKPWNRLHTIRTLATVISLILVLIACVTRYPAPEK